MSNMNRFHIATPEDIFAGKVTDAYFVRTRQVLQQNDIHKQVVMELRVQTLPDDWPWAVLAGVEEAVGLLSGIQKPIDFFCMDEGTVFRSGDPVGYLIGDYQDICLYETALLGLLCQASGIATRAARCVKAAEGRAILSFGARRLHPALAPMIDRSAYLGGCQGFSTVVTADQMGIQASGTLHDGLVLIVGDTVEAAQLFDQTVDPRVPRIALVGSFNDEKFESLQLAETLGEKLYGIRLDTPVSRRGDFVEILHEVRWELDLHGFKNVRLIVSGGIDEHSIRDLNPYCYGYGVGSAISNAPALDLSLDIVEMDGEPIARRGRWAGRKRLLDPQRQLMSRKIVPWLEDDPHEKYDLLTLKIHQGQAIATEPNIKEIRDKVRAQLAEVSM